MKKKLNNLKWFTLGIILTVLVTLLIVPVLASFRQVQATLNYNDIKITLDGTAIVPRDANGNIVEPFIIDGTTYLPVRGIAAALGLDVNWEENTNTVILTTPEANEETDDTTTTSTSDYVLVTGFAGLDSLSMVTIGGTYKLSVTVLPENATYKEIAFASSNPDVVSVDKNGLLTSLDFGASLITVTAGGVSNSSYVYSGDSFVPLLESNELILKKGDVFDLNNTFLTNPESIRDNIIWSSYDLTEYNGKGNGYSHTYDSTRATVENGIVTCLEPGLVVVFGKLIFENTAGATTTMEWFLKIEE